jgi:pimeloyl-ACP methyl ester carboxylesterase
MRGEHTPLPTRRIAEMLARAIPGAAADVVAGAGHMAPVTHPDAVAAALGRHLCRMPKEQPADQRRSA